MKYFAVVGRFAREIKKDQEFMKVLKQHHAFIKQGIDEGDVLFAGPNPAGGGLIVVKGESEEAVKEWFETDPFKIENINEYEFIEFRCFDGQDFVKGWFK